MNNAEKNLVERLKPGLAIAGFNWLKSRAMFVRKEPYGFSSLSWTSHSTSDEGGRLELAPVLGVRHNSVEDLVNQLGLIYGDDNKRFTTTVTRGLGLFPFSESNDNKQYIRLASIDADIEHAASAITAMLNSDGEDFFNRYSSLLECSRGLNNPLESKVHPLCNNFPRRAYYGVAAAIFAENDRVPELVSQYLHFAMSVLPKQYDQIATRLQQLTLAAQSDR